MTSYSIVYPSLPTGAATSQDAVTDDNGIQFKITSSGYQLSGYYYYVPSGGDTTASQYQFALWSTTNGTTGTLVTGSSLTGTGGSGTLTAGAWNYFALGTPVALTSGTTYVAEFHIPAGVFYSYVHFFWTTGAGSSGITSGPITAPNASSALNGAQQPFIQSQTSPTFPTSEFDNAWYGIDVNVTSAPGANNAALTVTAGRTAAVNVTHHRGASLTAVATVSAGPPIPPVPFNAVPGRMSPGLSQPGNPFFVTVQAQAQPVAVTAAIHATGLGSKPGGANRVITTAVTATAKVTRHGTITRVVTAGRAATGAAIRHRSESRPVTVTISAGAAKPGNTHSAGTRPVFTAAFQAAAMVLRHRTTARPLTWAATAAAATIHHRSESRPVTVVITAHAVIPGGTRGATRPVTATITAVRAHTTSRGSSRSLTVTVAAAAAKRSAVPPPLVSGTEALAVLTAGDQRTGGPE